MEDNSVDDLKIVMLQNSLDTLILKYTDRGKITFQVLMIKIDSGAHTLDNTLKGYKEKNHSCFFFKL